MITRLKVKGFKNLVDVGKRGSHQCPQICSERGLFPTNKKEIVRRVDALTVLADTIEKQVEAATIRTAKFTQAILAKAFRGELVPTEVELARREGRSYELASVLIQRTKQERQARESLSAKRVYGQRQHA